jgi:large subunit ribosomal protein L25
VVDLRVLSEVYRALRLERRCVSPLCEMTAIRSKKDECLTKFLAQNLRNLHIPNSTHTVAVLDVLEAHRGVSLERGSTCLLEILCPQIPASTAATMASCLAPRVRAEGLLKRFWARETHAGRVTPPGFPAPPPVATELSLRTIPNPFIPILNPITRRWRPPRYSRRRQADLVKAARLLQVETILPLGPKGQRKLGGTPPKPVAETSTLIEKTREPITWAGEPPPVNEKGLYGSRRFMFKGHKWERRLPEREQTLHDFKLKHDKQRYVFCWTNKLSSINVRYLRTAVDVRNRKLERRAERARREAGLLQ